MTFAHDYRQCHILYFFKEILIFLYTAFVFVLVGEKFCRGAHF